MSVSLDSVRDAAKVLQGQVLRTPLLHSRTLSAITGAEIWIKFENMQFTASFKERGARNKLAQLDDAEKAAGVIAVSAGNHAQGVAYHAKQLGIPATIVMPRDTPHTKVLHTRGHGAEVVLAGESLVEASETAHALEAERGLTFIHPYDDDAIIAGQGTIALEMIEDGPAFDALVVPVGGGGLIAGIATAAKGLSPQTRVVGVQSVHYPNLYRTLRGEQPEFGASTIAEGIAVKVPGGRNVAIARELVDEVLLVEEAHLERAVTLYADVEKTIAEGAGAAALAALLAYPERFSGQCVGLVLCGGNIDTRLLASVLTRSLVREQRLTNVRIVGDDRPGLLAKVASVLGDNDANIMEVSHNRTALDVPAKGAEFDILMETRDAEHTRQVLDALAAAGYPPR